MTNGLKVYYIPVKVFYNQCVLPTMICSLPLIRYILLREKIQIIHGHSAFSALAHETMVIGSLLGMKVCLINKLLYLTNCMFCRRLFLLIIVYLVLLMLVLLLLTNFYKYPCRIVHIVFVYHIQVK